MNTPENGIAITGNQESQFDFMWDFAPSETAYIGGLGSGKSYAGARKVLMLHAMNQCPGLISSPTYGDVQRFQLPALMQALDEWKWPHRDKTSADVPRIEVGDYPLLVLSAEDPSRFAGFEVGHIWVDEAPRIKTNRHNPLKDAPTQIRSRLRAKNAKTLHIAWTGTPEGIETFIQDQFVLNPIPQRRLYVGKTRKNKHLPPGYIDSLLASLPPEVVDQYMNGIACSLSANRAHPGFSVAGNVRPFDIKHNLIVHLGADYNVDPLCFCLCQEYDGKLWVLDELIITGGTTVETAVAEAHAKGWGANVVFMHPDKSAKARSTVGDPEFLVMQRTATAFGWRHKGSAGGANPPIASRLANLSRLCLNAAGDRCLVVHPRCKRIVDELLRTARLDNGGYDPGEKSDRGHVLDALGYVAYDLMGPKPKAGGVTVPGLV